MVELAQRAGRSPARSCGQARRLRQARARGAASRWWSPRSTARARAAAARTSPAASCAAPACARWARWRRGWTSGTPTSSFGHTHRAGPLPGRPRVGVARAAVGARLVELGLLDLRLDLPHRARPARAPTGRGRACSSRTPARRRCRRLLLDRTHADLLSRLRTATGRATPSRRRSVPEPARA